MNNENNQQKVHMSDELDLKFKEFKRKNQKRPDILYITKEDYDNISDYLGGSIKQLTTLRGCLIRVHSNEELGTYYGVRE